jgi:pimeloyl-ACP methyl ester carboxylesterase
MTCARTPAIFPIDAIAPFWPQPRRYLRGLRPDHLAHAALLGLESFAPVPENDPRVSAMQHCRLVKVPKAGHWVHHDQLDLFLKETKAFLER